MYTLVRIIFLVTGISLFFFQGYGNLITLVPRKPWYHVIEGDTLSIVLDAYDVNGDRAYLTEEIWIRWMFPTEHTLDTAWPDEDYIQPSPLLFGTDGNPRMSVKLDIEILDDQIPENAEYMYLVFIGLSGNTTVSGDGVVVVIEDNDNPNFFILNNKAVSRRRGYTKNVDLRFFVVVNDHATINEIRITSNPYPTARHDIVEHESGVGVTLTRGSKVNEYTIWANLDVSGRNYITSAYTYVSPRLVLNKRVEQGPSLRVLPLDYPCTKLAWDVNIVSPFKPKFAHGLRWRFISDRDMTNRVRFLPNLNGHPWITISECAKTGLYIISRKGGYRRGKVVFIRVIQSDCPAGWVHSQYDVKDCANQTTNECRPHRGWLDPSLDLCTCAPGFAGKYCELSLPTGGFGANNDFRLKDVFTGNRRGKCVLFGLRNPYGATCAAGYQGLSCCDECPRGWHGANCAEECDCNGGVCDPYDGDCDLPLP